MSLIKAKTNEHRLILISLPLLTTGNKEVDQVQINFDNSWPIDSATKCYIQFVKNDNVYSFELQNNTATIPTEVMSEPGRFSFAVFVKKNDEIIKTSTFCPYVVLKGADAGAAVVDWNAFKRSLVDLLKSIFSFELDYDSTVEEILAVLSTAEDGAAVKKFFVDLLNFTVMGGFLDYDQSLDDISLNVTVVSDRVNSELSDFSSLQNSLKRIYDNYLNDSSEGEIDIDPPYLFYIMAIEAYIQAETSIPDANEVNF